MHNRRVCCQQSQQQDMHHVVFPNISKSALRRVDGLDRWRSRTGHDLVGRRFGALLSTPKHHVMRRICRRWRGGFHACGRVWSKGLGRPCLVDSRLADCHNCRCVTWGRVGWDGILARAACKSARSTDCRCASWVYGRHRWYCIKPCRGDHLDRLRSGHAPWCFCRTCRNYLKLRLSLI